MNKDQQNQTEKQRTLSVIEEKKNRIQPTPYVYRPPHMLGAAKQGAERMGKMRRKDKQDATPKLG